MTPLLLLTLFIYCVVCWALSIGALDAATNKDSVVWDESEGTPAKRLVLFVVFVLAPITYPLALIVKLIVD